MHLRSITLKGFKSFPDRTRLEFAKGVSVIVGPNGSGKSNVTDAVLWALGEQSPLAVRGQTMQDVIFSGGPGVASRSATEVEVVIDDADFELGTGFSELSISRRLDRSGDGEYRLNGARCRLVDVLEALSDTGLGKEMHSVVSQGRVESVIHSTPHDRRLLVEEAAGLGKHRKRRRRAELKLARTDDNLARALEVEREARSRLRPLKRQAEAADLHERLERQALEARTALAADDVGAARERLSAAESKAEAARRAREQAERRLKAVAERREAAERQFAASARAREALSSRLFAATAATDRVEMRLERVREVGATAEADAARLTARLRRLESEDAEATASGSTGGDARHHPSTPDPIARLEAELAALDAAAGDPDGELERLRSERESAEDARSTGEERLAQRRVALRAADADVVAAIDARRAAEAQLETARSEHGAASAELEALIQLARLSTQAPAGGEPLAEELRVDRGYELALAAAIGPLVRAAVAADIDQATALLEADGGGEAAVLIESPPAEPGSEPAAGARPPDRPAERLLDHVHCGPRAARPLERLLADAWVVDSLAEVGPGFRGVAVTRSGRALLTASGELRQVAAGADERLLERLSRRDELAAAVDVSARRLEQAEHQSARAARSAADAEEARDGAAEALRAASRELEVAEERTRAAARALGRREETAGRGEAVRRAELGAELRAERRIAERLARERAGRRRLRQRLHAGVERGELLHRWAADAVPALESAVAAVIAHRESLHAELEADEAAGARTAAELRSCAQEEARLQNELRGAGDRVTELEVAAQRERDATADAEGELAEIARRLGSDTDVAVPDRSERLLPGQRSELRERVERLALRRERLGAVNPLAKGEYDEAVARVEELERQRTDLETALAELQGVITETDRRIRESFEGTFAATARNFEEVVEDLFPAGRGRLRLVTPDRPRPVLGGDLPERDPAADPTTGADPDAAPADRREPGIEVEVTPAGKSTRRLSLMSGGERSLVALAFLFAVFLARPCPFYVLDEVEAALDDLNIDRFLRLVRRCAERAQFIVVTHQKRTMDAADCLYGVSMGGDGVSKVVSRRLPRTSSGPEADGAAGSPAARSEAAA